MKAIVRALVAAMLLAGFSVAQARTPGCITCDPAWDPNLPCAGDNCNDGEGNDGGSNSGGDSGDSGDTGGSGVDSDTVAKDDDDNKEVLIGAIAIGIGLAILDSTKTPEEKLQQMQEFRQGKRGMVVPHLNVTEQGHSYGLQYEMRF